MVYLKNFRAVFLAIGIAQNSIAVAGDDPRHELMEGVGKASKPVGKMFKGELDYDAKVVMKSLRTWHDT